MKTVAYLTPLYFGDASCVGGGERYPLNLATGVVEASAGEYRVEILSFGPKAERVDVLPGVTLRLLPCDRPPAHPLDPMSWELPLAIGDCDLLHVHQVYTRPSEVGAVLARAWGKPLCVTDHGGRSGDIGATYDVVQLYDRVVCQSEYAARMLPTARNVVLVKGGVDGRRFAPPNIRPTRDRVLFVGRLLAHKGIDRLIEAVPPDLPLTCCGRPYDPEYFALLRRLADGKKVEFVTDATDDQILDLYSRAWAVVLPSVYRDRLGRTHVQPELMGLTLLEAMACGTPAICSRVGGMPEFIRHGETGFVFDDLDELAGYLTRLAGQPDLVYRMGKAARVVVETEFDLRVCGAKLVTLYRELISGTASVRRVAA